MSYQVLARQWRPKSFSEVVGQQHVLQALTNALTHQRLHHAYLLSGTRGVGKTTIARILARSLNCVEGVTATPCGQCEICQQIDQGRFVDLLEIDAASRTKVEDTREILENVQYRPTQGRYKVYLIDEVHMLSRHSFNALLKTLEEPPEHAIFLLATTDPDKLPVTVLSRCLQFQLRALTKDEIAQQLNKILSAENLQFDDSALQLIARAARGSMRDALSLTDQAIAQGNQAVSEEVVALMLGSLNPNDNIKLLKLVASGHGKEALNYLRELPNRMTDIADLLAELQNVLHQIALAQLAPEFVDSGLAEAKEGLQELAQNIPAEQVQVWYRLVLEGRKELPYSADTFSSVEMTVLRMLNFRLGDGSVSIEQSRSEVAPQPKAAPTVATPATPESVPEAPVIEPKAEVSVEAEPEPSVPTQQVSEPEERHEHNAQQGAPVNDELNDLLATRSDIMQSIRSSSDKPESTSPPKPEIKEAPATEQTEQVSEPIQITKQAETLDLTPNIRSAADIDPWSASVDGLNTVGITRQILLHTKLEQLDNGYRLLIDDNQRALFSDDMEEQLRSVLSKLIMDEPLDIGFASLSGTPFIIQQEINRFQLGLAEQKLNDHSEVQKIASELDAQVVAGSIQPRV
ncbi:MULTISPECIES: DNA polymerase III subunit gamma/tau [Gammaproteobacteria]|uniref:DNA polymerase III subunit gamma/tau n=1 Tax=Gammaproteobacteria TaxID=1236 RepID=UPI000DD0BA90|nr:MULTISPECIES: DNA polymerase III subunit gamma/tau [Gammaproteobacteria]RTE85992.1 DNA polymerase III subunit gamma/tau [Aliidiomarina sp. B3213]TCZ91346.1 DNA polymerase III subunit gamma/tau [Lysobacter sp. N42]